MIQKITETIMKEQKNRFKINYSLAYILRNIETDELRYFHASYNNHLMLETALLISNRQELLDFLNSIVKKVLSSQRKTIFVFSDAWPCSMLLTVVIAITLQSNCFMNTVPILT